MDIENTVRAAFLAAERGAATIYHAVLETGVRITAWEAADPLIGVLINDGLSYAENALVRFGVPSSVVALAAEDILAALKAMAALDATVPSVATTSVTTTTAVAEAAGGSVA